MVGCLLTTLVKAEVNSNERRIADRAKDFEIILMVCICLTECRSGVLCIVVLYRYFL